MGSESRLFLSVFKSVGLIILPNTIRTVHRVYVKLRCRVSSARTIDNINYPNLPKHLTSIQLYCFHETTLVRPKLDRIVGGLLYKMYNLVVLRVRGPTRITALQTVREGLYLNDLDTYIT